MPSGDGTQHGREEQYRPDGGFDLHHGTGQTFERWQDLGNVAAMVCVLRNMSTGEGLGWVA